MRLIYQGGKDRVHATALILPEGPQDLCSAHVTFMAAISCDAPPELESVDLMDAKVDDISLASIYAGWDEDRRLMSASIAPLTDEQLALRAAPHLRSIGHLVAHLVAARARMIHWILGEGGSELDALAVWDGFDQPAPLTVRPASELVQGLEMTGSAIQQALNRWTPGDLDQVVEWRYGDEIHTYTRQRMIWNLVRHDYHHHGEIALTMGIYGLTAPDF